MTGTNPPDTTSRAGARHAPSTIRRLLRAVASLQLCVVLLASTALLAGVGTFLRAEIYHSPLFVFLLAALAVNVVSCVLTRVRRTRRSLASVVMHLSVVMILLGGACYLGWGVEAYVELIRGQPTTTCYDRESRPLELGFSLELLDVEQEYDPDLRKLLAVSIPSENVEAVVPVDGLRIYDLPGTLYRVAVERDVADFARSPQVPEQVRRIEALHGPAMRIAVMPPDGSRDPRWLFAENQAIDINEKADPKVKVSYFQRPTIANWASHIRIAGDETVVRVNDPTVRGAWRIYQLGYDESRPDRTLLRLTRDPGVPVVYLGFIMLCVGVVARLWFWRWIK